MEERGLEDKWFQQDGATTHTVRLTIQLLNDVSPRRLISRSSDLACPARSPDLTALDSFLWDNIRHEIEETQLQMLQDVMKSVLRRAESCIENRGHHLADIISQS
ncbi:hypothetical protein GWI33_003523 [Rhynchophorus ferrugineus]|uniref:Uncharacterized protein n=1 Tax=Rhynchophorus ferrugineus TaxID=354439 RepID=A0A834HRH5_RHYFE|nr:hypothetical protein GWI33_003523 [Rhynchophorus ferrugineus]